MAILLFRKSEVTAVLVLQLSAVGWCQLPAGEAEPPAPLEPAARRTKGGPRQSRSAVERAERNAALPAEETRLNTAEFREGLKRRGLTEILEQHVREFPPTGNIETLLMLREVKLAEFADVKRTTENRLGAAAAANQILGQLLEQEPADPRRFEWRFDLAHSLLYDEGQAFATNILFRGGGKRDRERLRRLAGQAATQAALLQEQLALEYRRIDELPISEFEKLEASKYIEGIDRLSPRVDYLVLWSLFYEAISHEPQDPVWANNLSRVAELLPEKSPLLTTAHNISHVQVQATLLAGMTQRRLNKHIPARAHFDKAIATAEQLNPRSERKQVEWALHLAGIERIRNDADSGRYDDAQANLKRFFESHELGGEDTRRLTIVAGIVEKYIHLARASAAAKAGREGEARQLHEEAWQALAKLARRSMDLKKELYATLYELAGPDADPSDLDPIEQGAWLAGLLSEASRAESGGEELMRRAVTVGSGLAKNLPERVKALAPELLPELQYNVAVAQYRLGNIEEAAELFLAIAQAHPTFDNAGASAVFAAELSAELYADVSRRGLPKFQRLYREALRTLVTDYADSPRARYYRFPYAQLLDELAEYDLAAVQYAYVGPDEELFLESSLLRLRSLALGLQAHSRRQPADVVEFRRRFNDFTTVQLDFMTHAGSALRREAEAPRAAAIRSLVATARILKAEVEVLPEADRASQAVATLEGWESEFPDEPALAARVWHVRLLAFDRLGRLDDAIRALPNLVRADARGAGALLQPMYLRLSREAESLRSQGVGPMGQTKAELALAVAQQLEAWHEGRRLEGGEDTRRELKIQVAEAMLLAGRFESARHHFQAFMAGQVPFDDSDPRIQLGLAEAMFGLKDFAAALPLFHRLATGLPVAEFWRWKALLRDLQCRTELGHPPEGIVKVIQQEEFLDPQLGGPALEKQFQQLRQENERRAKGGK